MGGYRPHFWHSPGESANAFQDGALFERVAIAATRF